MNDHDISQPFNRGCYARSLGLPLEAVGCFETNPGDMLEWGKGWTWQNASGSQPPICWMPIREPVVLEHTAFGGKKLDNVVLWPGVTKVDTAPENVLKKVVDADLEHMIVLGYTPNGDEFFCATYADGPNVLWLLQRTIHKLMEIGRGGEDDD